MVEGQWGPVASGDQRGPNPMEEVRSNPLSFNWVERGPGVNQHDSDLSATSVRAALARSLSQLQTSDSVRFVCSSTRQSRG